MGAMGVSGRQYDVVVVGARVAGAAVAMLLSRDGQRVLALDRSPAGSDTLSTHALMRGGVLQLSRWGLLGEVVAANTPAVENTSFHYGDEVVVVPIKPRDGVAALFAPRRAILDAILVEGARSAGAEVWHGPRVVDLVRSASGRVSGVVVEERDGTKIDIRARLVIGADGLTSTVARLVGARTYRLGRHACGVVYGYWPGLVQDGYHWYYRLNASAGAIPTNHGLTCVFAAVPRSRFFESVQHDLEAGFHRVLEVAAPDLARGVRRGAHEGKLRGFAGQPGYFRQSVGPGWALVGDAGYFRDPITAHGITDALRDAESLARAVSVGTDRALVEYQRVRDDLSTGLFDASDEIASFSWDLDTLKARHLFMSREMNREVEWLSGLRADALSLAS